MLETTGQRCGCRAVVSKPRRSLAGLFGSGGGTVEADETYWGNTKRSKAARGYKDRGYAHKEKIVSLVERGGNMRSFHVQSVTAKTLKPILLEQIAKDAHLMTSCTHTRRGRRAGLGAQRRLSRSVPIPARRHRDGVVSESGIRFGKVFRIPIPIRKCISDSEMGCGLTRKPVARLWRDG